MTMARAELTVFEGDTWRFNCELRTAAGAPFSLAGMTAHMQLRTDLTVAPFATLHSGAGGGLTLNSPTPGDIAVEVPSTSTVGVCRRKQSIRIETELELRDGSSPPRIFSYIPLAITVVPEATRVP